MNSKFLGSQTELPTTKIRLPDAFLVALGYWTTATPYTVLNSTTLPEIGCETEFHYITGIPLGH